MENLKQRAQHLASTDLRVSEVAEMWSIVERIVFLEDFPYIDPSSTCDANETNTEYNRLFDFVQKVIQREIIFDRGF